MYKYTEKELHELKRLYETGKELNFDITPDEIFSTKANHYLQQLRQSEGFTKLKNNNEAVRHSFAKAERYVKYSKSKSLNDLRMLITNLYPFK